jgi:hypothetical protein
MKQNNAFRVRESEFRWVIHETHSCQAERLENAVHVKIWRRKDVPWEGTVHVYEVRGHPNATRCYAWVEPLGKTAIIIRAVLHSDKISSPEKAVQSAMRRAR